jgi:hypothetical protein
MAKANTTQWEHGGFCSGRCDNCKADFSDLVCKKNEKTHRKFYYPTYMNGDAECLVSLCDSCYKLTPPVQE